jgi:hypothetical protein
LKEFMIPEYLFYNDYDHDDENLWVDISGYVERVVNAGAQYASQFGPGWKNYNPSPSGAEVKEMKENRRQQIRSKDGSPWKDSGIIVGCRMGLASNGTPPI